MRERRIGWLQWKLENVDFQDFLYLSVIWNLWHQFLQRDSSTWPRPSYTSSLIILVDPFVSPTSLHFWCHDLDPTSLSSCLLRERKHLKWRPSPIDLSISLSLLSVVLKSMHNISFVFSLNIRSPVLDKTYPTRPFRRAFLHCNVSLYPLNTEPRTGSLYYNPEKRVPPLKGFSRSLFLYLFITSQ